MSTLLETLSYAVAIAGTILDQVSTRIVLSRPYVYESNPTSVMLMTLNLWIPFDVALLIASIGMPMLLIHKWGFVGRHAVLVYPLVYGLMRLVFGLWNLHWLI